MSEWIKVGSRYINLNNVTEVRLHERPQFARLYFTNGATVDLDEEDSATLLVMLGERVMTLPEVHRKVIATPSTS